MPLERKEAALPCPSRGKREPGAARVIRLEHLGDFISFCSKSDHRIKGCLTGPVSAGSAAFSPDAPAS